MGLHRNGVFFGIIREVTMGYVLVLIFVSFEVAWPALEGALPVPSQEVSSLSPWGVGVGVKTSDFNPFLGWEITNPSTLL
jgi:hypothetical protein